MFGKNVHPYERGARVVLGVVITSMAFIGPASPWFFLGLIPLATGLFGNCPLYSVLGFSTCPTKPSSKAS